MNIEKSLQRLQWRFKNESVKIGESKITINQSDIEAIDFLIEWITNQKKHELQQNILFAKLYAHVFSQEVKYYKGNFKLAQKKMNEYLSQTINSHYESFCQTCNETEAENFYEQIGISEGWKNKPELSKQTETIKQHEADLIKYLNGVYPNEKLYQSLNNQITESIIKFKSLP